MSSVTAEIALPYKSRHLPSSAIVARLHQGRSGRITPSRVTPTNPLYRFHTAEVGGSGPFASDSSAHTLAPTRCRNHNVSPAQGVLRRVRSLRHVWLLFQTPASLAIRRNVRVEGSSSRSASISSAHLCSSWPSWRRRQIRVLWTHRVGIPLRFGRSAPIAGVFGRWRASTTPGSAAHTQGMALIARIPVARRP